MSEIERRAVATLFDLQKLGLNASVVLLVIFCIAIAVSAAAWFYVYSERETLYRNSQLEEQRDYNRQMLGLVSNIQSDLESEKKEMAIFNDRIMNVVDRHTQQIDTIWTLLKVLEWLPSEVQQNGNILFQPPKVREELYNSAN